MPIAGGKPRQKTERPRKKRDGGSLADQFVAMLSEANPRWTIERKPCVIYHYEDGSWWAESPDVDRWYAAGDSYAEVAKLAKEGIPFALTAAIKELLDATSFHDSDLGHMT